MEQARLEDLGNEVDSGKQQLKVTRQLNQDRLHKIESQMKGKSMMDEKRGAGKR